MNERESRPAILVVDDIPANLIAMRVLLKGQNADIVTAASAREALHAMLEQQFSLILLDVMMPEMDGYELASIIREEESTADIPIIFITAQDKSKTLEMKGYSQGAVDVLFKPVDKAVLISKVRVFLQLHEQNYRMLQLVEAEEQRKAALSAAQAKSEFLANMSHEIRTPLNAVLGFAELLGDTGLNDIQNDYLQTIRQSGQLLLGLINDILDISKVEAGKLELEKVPLDLKQLFKQVIAISSSHSFSKDVELQFQYPDDLPRWFTGDPTRLKQVLLNLVSNAFKFTEHGRVLLQLNSVDEHSPDGDEISISVEDTGIGMTPEEQRRIFESFTQADSSTTRKFGGTGLGLSIVSQLTQCMGGTVSVTSKPGMGSRFTVTLKMPQCRPPEDHSEEHSSDDISGLSVLLVEDNPANQKLAGIILKKAGCEVTVAANGLLALDELNKESFDIILMDLQMPEMGGIECTLNIRRNQLSRAPIIALTADVVKEDMKRCFESGMQDFISKPINKGLLISTLFKWKNRTVK